MLDSLISKYGIHIVMLLTYSSYSILLKLRLFL
jgi:hypothetical protein